MTRRQMIARYGEIQCCTFEEAASAIDTVITLISEGLEEDGEVNLKYFGKFKIRPFKAHRGYDFSKGESIEIPAHNVIRFTPCEEWRRQILRKEIHKNG